jgi:hypothetical protein
LTGECDGVIRAVGFNPAAARYGGISVARSYVLAMGIAGGFAGLAGALDVLGWKFRLDSTDFSVRVPRLGIIRVGRPGSHATRRPVGISRTSATTMCVCSSTSNRPTCEHVTWNATSTLAEWRLVKRCCEPSPSGGGLGLRVEAGSSGSRVISVWALGGA